MTSRLPGPTPRPLQVLVVEDDGAARRSLAESLRAEKCVVFEAADGTFGLEIASREPLDLVVLDLMLPRLGGEQMLARLRTGNDVPVIVVSAKRNEDDRVTALDLGADDYLVKPFTVRELLARMRAVLRRRDAVPNELTLGDVTIDFGSKTAQRGDQKIVLTAKEFALLVHLARCRGRLVSREELDRAIHPGAAEPREDVSNVVDVLVLRLRRKLGRDLISTRRGQGFIIEG
ncbi:MAG: response regulator transcription factor [Pirellulales bacterium]